MVETIPDLSWSQRIKLRITGSIFLRFEKREGWTAFLPIYLVRCSKHGLFETYPQGEEGKFHCPQCHQELADYVAALNQ